VGLFNADVVDLTSLLATEKIQDSKATKDTVMQICLTIALIMNESKVKYEPLWNKLENALLVGQDSYPKTIGDATHLLTNWKSSAVPSTHPTPNPNNTDRRNPDGTPAVSFATT